MNERIDELIEECTSVNDDLVYDGRDSYMKTTEYFDKEKFAEMIVKECAKFLAENSGYDNSNNAWHPEPEDLLKHFGVEE